MNDQIHLEQARTKMIRYRILKVLDAGRPYPVGEGLLFEILSDADLRATQHEIRRALQYLCDKKFLDIKEAGSHWEARLLPAGVDFIENPRAESRGIARPVTY